jgi:hypothetical protein
MSGFGQVSVSILSALCPLFVVLKTCKRPELRVNLRSPFFCDSNHANKKKRTAPIDHFGCVAFDRFSDHFF